MTKFHKLLAFLIAAVICCSASIALTAAWLTDRDSEANVFTVGDVEIDLEGTLDNYELLPGVTVTKNSVIKNIGPNAAWVWATVAVPTSLAEYLNVEPQLGSEWFRDTTVAPDEVLEKDGVSYTAYTYLYDPSRAPGAETISVMTNITLDYRVDIAPNGDWYMVENGVTSKIEGWNLNNNMPDVFISAYAIQEEGFDNVREAYAAYHDQWGKNGVEWASSFVTSEDDNSGSDTGSDEVTSSEESQDGYSYALSESGFTMYSDVELTIKNREESGYYHLDYYIGDKIVANLKYDPFDNKYVLSIRAVALDVPEFLDSFKLAGNGGECLEIWDYTFEFTETSFAYLDGYTVTKTDENWMTRDFSITKK